MICWKDKCSQKYIAPQDLEKKIAILRAAGKTIATLNGSFDLMHAGHLHIIYEASQVADVLVVALNTDLSIQRYKSLSRPIIPLEYRLQMMSAIQFIDFLTWFDETDPIRVLSVIKPDVHVNGMEYGQNCIEADTVHKYGGRLHLVERIPSLSTTDIINKILSPL